MLLFHFLEHAADIFFHEKYLFKKNQVKIMATSLSIQSNSSTHLLSAPDSSLKENKMQEKSSAVYQSIQKTEDHFLKKVTKTHLWTIEELEKNAVAHLGSMDQDTYESYIAKMDAIAKTVEIAEPKLTIGLKFKSDVRACVKEYPYPIQEKTEWSTFELHVSTMCEYSPKVFVIDGSKFD